MMVVTSFLTVLEISDEIGKFPINR